MKRRSRKLFEILQFKREGKKRSENILVCHCEFFVFPSLLSLFRGFSTSNVAAKEWIVDLCEMYTSGSCEKRKQVRF